MANVMRKDDDDNDYDDYDVEIMYNNEIVCYTLHGKLSVMMSRIHNDVTINTPRALFKLYTNICLQSFR